MKNIDIKLGNLQKRLNAAYEKKKQLDGRITEIETEIQTLKDQQKLNFLDRIMSNPEAIQRLRDENILDDNTIDTWRALTSDNNHKAHHE